MRNFGLFLFSYATRISTLKHMAEGSSGSKSPSQVPNLSPTEATVVVNKTWDKTMEAARLLDIIKDRSFDQAEFTELDALLEQVDKENDAKKQELFQLLGYALKDDSGFSRWDKSDLDRLKTKWESAYKNAEIKKSQTEVTITAATAQKVEQVKRATPIKTVSFMRREKAKEDVAVDKGAINDVDSNKSLQARLAFLSDMDGMSGVENNNKFVGRGNQKYIIGEKQLFNVLNHTIKTPKDLTDLIRRFGIEEKWTSEGMTEMREGFRNKVITRAGVVASLARIVLGDLDAGSWLVSVIEWKEQEFIDALLKNPEQFKKIKTEIESRGPLGIQILSTLLSIGVSVASLGRLHVSLEHRDIGAWHPLSVILGDGVNLTAKLRMFEGVLQLNPNDRETKIIKDTLAFSESLSKSFNADKTITIPKDGSIPKDQEALMRFYNQNIGNLPPGSDRILVDELSRRHMLALGQAEAGWSGKWFETGFNFLSLSAYIGITAQMIGTRIQEVGYNGAAAAEGRSNARKIDLKAMGITAEKLDGRIKYTLPISPDSISEDLAAFGAVIEDGKVVLLSDVPLDFHRDTVYHANGDTETRIAINKKEGVSVVPKTRVASQKAVVRNAQEARETNKSKTLSGSIYVMSRHKDKYPKFDTMLQQIGERDYDAAYANLTSMARHGSKVAKNILALVKTDGSNRDQVLQTVNTYTYGGIGKNRVRINQKDYKKNRDKATIDAENRLAPVSRNKTAEAFFAGEKIHTPTHINTLLPWQALSVSVYATPKGGTHRIDKYDGSIQVGGNIYTGAMSQSQKDRILSDHIPAMEKNRKELNVYLKESVKSGVELTSAEYTLMLKTGETPAKLTNEGFTMKNKPRFFEARAMINGNVCVNKVEGIGFPTFWAPEVPPQVVVVPAVETTEWFSAPVGQEITTTNELGIGVGPWIKTGKASSAPNPPTNTVPGGTIWGWSTNIINAGWSAF